MRTVISGATGDIGFAIAEALAPEHELILLGYKNEAAMRRLRERTGTPAARCFMGDLADEAVVTRFAEACLSDGQPVGQFIHTVGAAHIGLVQDMTRSDWERVIGVNLTSAFLLTKAILPGMIAGKSGRMLFVSSIWAREGAGMEVAYSAAKGGLDSFARALAKEVAPSGIAVNAVDLGMVNTKMNAHLDAGEVAAVEAEIPVGRQCTPAECAAFIRTLLAAPAYMTGQRIGFDGGW
ncbi:MAG: SDR family oxidoreductase [Eubacteriales bacterium]|nr:SDR family oxidoreductase [Eubacteriales bacterium]